MRHFHRDSLPDDGLLMTQGKWIPSFDDPMIAVLFLHKFTAFCIFFYVIGMLLHFASRSSLFDRGARRALSVVFGLLLLQIVLGLSVIGTGKSFWITNVHVLNGLAILALSFVFAVKSVRGRSDQGALANS